MRPQKSLLILIVVLAMIAVFGLQGCGLFGGGGDDADGGEAGEGGPGMEPGMEPGGGPGGPGMEPGMGEPGMEPGMGPGAPGMGGPGMGPGGPGMEPGGAAPEEPTDDEVGMDTSSGGTDVATAADATALVAQGMEAKNAGNLELASRKFQAAIVANPREVDAHWGLAWVAADMGDTEKAIRHFEMVKKLGASADRIAEADAALERLRQ